METGAWTELPPGILLRIVCNLNVRQCLAVSWTCRCPDTSSTHSTHEH